MQRARLFLFWPIERAFSNGVSNGKRSARDEQRVTRWNFSVVSWGTTTTEDKYLWKRGKLSFHFQIDLIRSFDLTLHLFDQKIAETEDSEDSHVPAPERLNRTYCKCKSACKTKQKNGTARGCHCRTANLSCDATLCKCGTSRKPCANKVREYFTNYNTRSRFAKDLNWREQC